MNILVVGSGAREHAICWKLSKSKLLTKLHAAPGNAAIAGLAKCHDVAIHDVDALANLAKRLKVDMVVIGAEGPLVAGLSNRLRKLEIACVGPSAASARLEGSKVFTKELMDRVQIPTSRWEAFSDVQAALAAINRWRGPVVIKADGLTGGRGAFVCMTKVQAERALQALLVDSVFGVAGRRVVVEEYLQGIEATVSVFTDGENLVPLPVVRSEKRRNDEDAGPNTDGMGAWLPVEDLYEQQIEEAVEAGLRPAIEDMGDRGLPYSGVLSADVMFTRTGPKILEYNCRLGEIESQVLMRTMEEDLVEVLQHVANGNVGEVAIDPEPQMAAAAVQLVLDTYPQQDDLIDAPRAIGGLADASEVDGVEIFFGDVVTTGKGKARGYAAAGGRVLTVTATADTVEQAAEKASEAASMITFDGKHMRTDIASTAGIMA